MEGWCNTSTGGEPIHSRLDRHCRKRLAISQYGPEFRGHTFETAEFSSTVTLQLNFHLRLISAFMALLHLHVANYIVPGIQNQYRTSGRLARDS